MQKISMLVASSMLAFAHAGSAAAQSTEERTSETRSGLEEIVVTAQRRSESAQDVPIAVTAFNADQLETLGITQPADLATAVPGLTINPTAGRSPVFLRGVGNNAYSTAPSVLTFVDGVYQPFDTTAGSNYNNVESLEVAKGPQGTLFGRNATGGVIQVTTRNPLRWQGVDAEVGLGNFSTTSANIYAAGLLGENVGADVAGFYYDQADGWGTNVADGSDFLTANRWGLRSRMVADLTEAFTVTVALDYSERQGEAGTAFSPAIGFPTVFDSGNGTNVALGPYDVSSDISPFYQSNEAGLAVTLNWHLGNVDLLSISSIRTIEEAFHLDVDAGPLNALNLDREDDRQAITQELQASGGSDGFLWVAGLFYYQLEAEALGPNFNGFITPFAFGTAPGVPFVIHSDDVTEAWAAYAQTTFEVLPETNLTLGARYTMEDRELSGFTTGSAFLSPGAGTQTASFEEPSYRVALDHHLTPDVLVYGSWSRGFNAGFYNQQAVAGFNDVTNPLVEPEFIDAYEVGFKSDLFDRTLRLNASAFRYDYSNLQQQIYVNNQVFAINAASAQIQGVDFEIVSRPVDSITLSLGGTYLDTEYQSYPLAPNYDTQLDGSVIAVGALDAAGNQTVYAPEWSIQAAAMHTFETGIGTFDTAFTVNYVSDMFGDPQNEFVTPERTLLGLTETWTSSDERTHITLWGRNLTDEEWNTSLAIVTPNGALGQQGAPLTYGITIGRRF